MCALVLLTIFTSFCATAIAVPLSSDEFSSEATFMTSASPTLEPFELAASGNRSWIDVPMLGTVWLSETPTTTHMQDTLQTAPLTTSGTAVFANYQPDLSRHPDLTFQVDGKLVTDGTPTVTTTYWITKPTTFMNVTWTGAVRNTPCYTCKTVKPSSTLAVSPSTSSSAPERKTMTYVSEGYTGTATILVTTTEYMRITYVTDQARWTASVPVTQLPWATMPEYQHLVPHFQPVLPQDNGSGFYLMLPNPRKKSFSSFSKDWIIATVEGGTSKTMIFTTRPETLAIYHSSMTDMNRPWTTRNTKTDYDRPDVTGR